MGLEVYRSITFRTSFAYDDGQFWHAMSDEDVYFSPANATTRLSRMSHE